jgi:muramidase (phage lysozyme)
MSKSQRGNRGAFLDMISKSEGTADIPNSDDGYRVLVGGTTFEGYADHPRIRVKLNDRLYSTAAGRYQILARIFDYYKALLTLPDFSPESQDRIALKLIRECHALEDVEMGRFETAVEKCKSRWASLPGSGYGQHENSIDKLKLAYQEAGGTVV